MTRIYREVNKTVGGEAGQLEGQCVVDLSAILTAVRWTLQSTILYARVSVAHILTRLDVI